MDFSQELYLTPGTNHVQLQLTTATGNKLLVDRILFLAQESEVAPTLHLFTIGVAKYQEAEHNLLYPVKDSQDIADLFKKQEGKAFKKVVLHSLTDEQATKENIDGLKAKLEGTLVNDMVIVYYSGHGLLSPNKDYYLSTHDVSFKDPTARGYAYESLEEMLDGIPARKKVILLDACHSGEVDKEDAAEEIEENTSTIDLGDMNFKGSAGVKVGNQSTFELMSLLFTDLRSNIGATIISASAGTQYALEDKSWQNGAFTYCLKQGLLERKADANSDQQIQLTELQEYVNAAVLELTSGKQRPTTRAENRVNDLVVWK